MASKVKKEEKKMGFFERMRVKGLIKKIRSLSDSQIKLVKELGNKTERLNEKELECIDELRMKLIKTIIGNKKEEIIGLLNIFEVYNEDGSEITLEILEKTKTDDLIALYEDLLNSLEKEVN
jgi:hypothetical protein